MENTDQQHLLRATNTENSWSSDEEGYITFIQQFLYCTINKNDLICI